MKHSSLNVGYVLPIVLLALSPSVRAQCKSTDPSGRFDGSATSSQVGKLDVSLNLLCESGVYKGALNTPIGAFTLISGSFTADTLTLELSANGNTIHLQAQPTGDALNGTFSTADDKGPLALHRVGDPTLINPSSALTLAQWHEDLSFLAKQLTTLHPDAYANTPKSKFDAAVHELDAKLDHLNPDEIYVGFDQIANLIGDGHTYVDFPPDRANLPLDITRFGAEERIDAVAAGYERALGARIVAISSTPLTRAKELAETVTPIGETDALRSLRADVFLSTGMMLHGLDITPARDAATFVLADDSGKQFSVEFKQHAPGADAHWVYAASPLPLSEKSVDSNAPCTYLSPQRTLYCNIKMVLKLEKPSQQMLHMIAKEHPDKVIIDLRQNGGGDYNLGLQYLVRPLQQDKSVNRKGHLFVLIGPDTFSAAMSNASQFRTMTNAVLVGDPIGERPNTFQEPREVTLPNSRLVVRYSTRFYKFATGPENIIRPDKQIEQSWTDYKAGRDDALEWILEQK
jgi:hypothetical protein